MDLDKLQFGVHGVEADGDRLLVIGRCYRGPLALGEVFRVVRPGSARAPGEGEPVSLTIDRIVAYRRELDQLDEGLTAQLRLSGAGREAVVPETVLATEGGTRRVTRPGLPGGSR